MSASMRGRHISPEQREKMSIAHRGVHLSPEHRSSIAAANLGRKQRLSPESRAKIVDAHLGKHHTLESIVKMSASMKACWDRKKGVISGDVD